MLITQNYNIGLLYVCDDKNVYIGLLREGVKKVDSSTFGWVRRGSKSTKIKIKNMLLGFLGHGQLNLQIF